MPSRDDVEVDCDDCDEPSSSEKETFSSIGDGSPRLMISLCSSSSELIECFCRMSGPVRDRAMSGLGQSLKLVCCSEGISPTRYNVSFPPGSAFVCVCKCTCFLPLFADKRDFFRSFCSHSLTWFAHTPTDTPSTRVFNVPSSATVPLKLRLFLFCLVQKLHDVGGLKASRLVWFCRFFLPRNPFVFTLQQPSSSFAARKCF